MKFADIIRFWENRLGGGGNNTNSTSSRHATGQQPPKSREKRAKALPKEFAAVAATKKEAPKTSRKPMNAHESDIRHRGRPISVDNRHDRRNHVTSACLAIKDQTASHRKHDADKLQDGGLSSKHHVSSGFALPFINRIKRGSRGVGGRTNSSSESTVEKRKLRSVGNSQRTSCVSKSSSDELEESGRFWSLKKKKRSGRKHVSQANSRQESESLAPSAATPTREASIDRTDGSKRVTRSPPKRVKSTKERKKSVCDTLPRDKPASAPSSLRSSPSHCATERKQVQELKRLWRRFPDMNEKFNQIQNFWQMKERKTAAQFVKERRCVVCGCFLTRSFYEKNGMLYCEDDYWSRFGQKCKKCACIITGPIVAVQDSKDASDPSNLESFSVIMVISFNPVVGNTPVELQVKDQSIPMSVKHGPLSKLPLEPIGQIVCGISCEEQSSMLVGDRILQVNGLSVKYNVKDLILRMTDTTSDVPLQLTVERKVLLSKSSVLLHWDLESDDYDDDILSMAVTHQNTIIDTQPQSYEFKSPAEERMNFDPNIDHQYPLNNGSYFDPVPSRTSDSDSSLLSCSILTPLMSSMGSDCCSTSNGSNKNKWSDTKLELDCNSAKSDPAGLESSFSETSVIEMPISRSSSAEGLDPTHPKQHSTPTNNPIFFPEFDDASSLSELILAAGSPEYAEHAKVLSLDSGVELSDNPSVPVNVSEQRTGSNMKSPSDISTNSSNELSSPTLIYKDSTTQSNSVSDLSDGHPTHSLHRKRRQGYKRSPGRDAKGLMPPEILNVISRGSIPPPEENEFPLLPIVKQKIDKPITGIVVNRSLCHPKRSHSLKTSNDGSTVLTRQISPSRVTPVKTSYQSDVSRSGQTMTSSTSYTTLVHSPPARDLNRSESMRIHGGVLEYCHRVFRPCDLIHGEVLGAGFFGKAIKVTHRDTGEVMVLKVLKSLDEDVEKAFIKEVKVMRNLNHPNVLRFIGVLYKDRRLNVITEFVECGTLRELYENMENEFPWRRRVEVARDIASGMSYLHGMQIIHRDLNSANCFVKKDGTVVVADFGLARIMQRQNSSLTRRKRYTVVGTPYWMAPEMLYNAHYDEAVDIFSFGIVLCELIGRVMADPDILPRRSDYGLDVQEFFGKFCGDCPPYYFALAILACDVNPDGRPVFKRLESLFQMLAIHQEVPQMKVPPEIEELTRTVYRENSLPLLNTTVYERYHLHKA